MKSGLIVFGAVLLSALVSYGTVKLVVPYNSALKTESTYDRVMRTGEIRCGYIPIKAVFQKDGNTGKLSGIGFDIITQAVKNLGLKIKWVGEAGYVSMSEDMRNGRYDMVCTPMMPTAQRGRVTDFSRPLFVMPAYVWINEKDKRVGDDLSWANNGNVTFSFVDGIVFDTVARREFPKAVIRNMPEIHTPTEQMLDVLMGKVDATIANGFDGFEFAKNNHHGIKRASEKPVMNLVYTFPLPKGEEKFRQMINVALDEMIDNETIDRLIDLHDTHPSSYIHLKKIY